MGRTPLRIAAATTLATLFIASTATAGHAATGEVTHPVPVAGTPGHYIVIMKADPLASYEGDVKGLKATKPDEGEQLWLTYYENIFNPARLKLGTMRREMPRRYWHNLPETVLISTLVQQARARTGQMLEQ